MITKLNGILNKSEGFPLNPTPRKDCHTLVLPSNKRFKQYVICPEQDCECLVYMSDLNTSMVEAIGIHEHPWWRSVSKSSTAGIHQVREDIQGCMDMGRRQQLQVVHYIYQGFFFQEANPFLSIQQIVEIQQRKASHGKILDQSTPAMTSSTRIAQPFHVQLQRQINSLQSSRSSISSGSSMSSRLTRSIPRTLESTVHTAT